MSNTHGQQVKSNIQFEQGDYSKPVKSDVCSNNGVTEDKAFGKVFNIPDIHPLYHVVSKPRTVHQWKSCPWPAAPSSFVFTVKVKCPNCPYPNAPGHIYDPEYKPLDQVPILSDNFKQQLNKLLQVDY